MTETEAQTHQRLINRKLILAGWNILDPTQVVEELDIETDAELLPEEIRTKYSSHRFADYALLIHGKPAAVVEAKRSSKDAELDVVHQSGSSTPEIRGTAQCSWILYR